MSFAHNVIIGVFVGFMAIVSVYLLLMPRPSLTKKSVKSHIYVGNPIRVYELDFVKKTGNSLTCTNQKSFSEAYKKKEIRHLVIEGYTYTIVSVVYPGNVGSALSSEMVIKLENQPNGVYKVNTSVPSLPTKPGALHVLGY